MKIKPITAVGYTFLVALISSLITVLCYHIFVFNTFSLDSSQPSALREIDSATVASSPIKNEKSIIEVMSYGCHYCASNEEEIEKFAATLPADSAFDVIHITAERNGLAIYAPVFATLEVMGLERQMRDRAFNAVLTRGINLADDDALNGWLKKMISMSRNTIRYAKVRPLPSAWNIWRKLPNSTTLMRRRCLLLIKNTWLRRIASSLNLPTICASC